jgi:hypothetical protein
VNIIELPQYILAEIFSYLTPEDLCTAAQVCRDWNVAQKADCLWKRHALAILDRETSQKSWKEQYRTLYHWKTGECKPVPLWAEGNVCGKFTLLEDNSAFELIRRYPDPAPTKVQVRNLVSRELRIIDLEPYGFEEYCSELHGSILTVWDTKGKILQFDVTTCVCVNQFNTEPFHSLYCNDSEIITVAENKVRILDQQKSKLDLTFKIPVDHKIQTAVSTPNFLIYVDYSSYFLFAVNKHNPANQCQLGGRVDGFTLEHACLEGCGSYCAALMNNGELLIYEEASQAEIRLKKTYLISKNLSNYCGHIYMYRNWVCVQKDGMFCVYDVRTGDEITKPIMLGHCDFRTNAKILIVRKLGRDKGLPFISTLYDFEACIKSQHKRKTHLYKRRWYKKEQFILHEYCELNVFFHRFRWIYSDGDWDLLKKFKWG